MSSESNTDRRTVLTALYLATTIAVATFGIAIYLVASEQSLLAAVHIIGVSIFMASLVPQGYRRIATSSTDDDGDSGRADVIHMSVSGWARDIYAEMGLCTGGLIALATPWPSSFELPPVYIVAAWVAAAFCLTRFVRLLIKCTRYVQGSITLGSTLEIYASNGVRWQVPKDELVNKKYIITRNGDLEMELDGRFTARDPIYPMRGWSSNPPRKGTMAVVSLREFGNIPGTIARIRSYLETAGAIDSR